MPCRILHTTDFHFGYFPGEGSTNHQRSSTQQDDSEAFGIAFRQEVKNVLIGILKNDDTKPHFWVLTGDFTNRNDTKGFSSFAIWFNDIVAQSGFDRKNVIFVPGNHDIFGLDFPHGHPTIDSYHKVHRHREILPPALSSPCNPLAYQQYREMLQKCGMPSPIRKFSSFEQRLDLRRNSGATASVLGMNTSWLSAIGHGAPAGAKDGKIADIHSLGGLWIKLDALGRAKLSSSGSDLHFAVVAVHHPKYYINWRDRYKALGHGGSYAHLAANSDIVIFGHNHPGNKFERLQYHFPLCAYTNFGGAMYVQDPYEPSIPGSQDSEFNKLPPHATIDLLEVDATNEKIETQVWVIEVVGNPGTIQVSATKQPQRKLPSRQEFGASFASVGKVYEEWQQEVTLYDAIKRSFSPVNLVQLRKQLIEKLASAQGFISIQSSDWASSNQVSFQAFGAPRSRNITHLNHNSQRKTLKFAHFVDILEFDDEVYMGVEIMAFVKAAKAWITDIANSRKFQDHSVTLTIFVFDFFNALITPEDAFGMQDFFRMQYILERTKRFRQYLSEYFFIDLDNGNGIKIESKIEFLSRKTLLGIQSSRIALVKLGAMNGFVFKAEKALDEMLNG